MEFNFKIKFYVFPWRNVFPIGKAHAEKWKTKTERKPWGRAGLPKQGGEVEDAESVNAEGKTDYAELNSIYLF
jgi:hypothetical protein